MKFDVYPPDINLNSSLDGKSFIAVATRADGVTLDVTADRRRDYCRRQHCSPGWAYRLYPAADGTTTL